MTEALNDRRKQILYRAHYRGFREADLLIGGFAKANVATMDADELSEFEALLAINDHDLYNWILGKTPAPANVEGGRVFEALRGFDVAQTTAPRRPRD